MNSCISDKGLKPAYHCVICRRSFSETGGHRIIAQKFRVFCFSNKQVGGGSTKKSYYSLSLNETKTEFIVFWGEVGFWSNENMTRAIETYKKNLHPYFCSYCGKRTCSLCGKPLILPVGSDYFTKEEMVCHSPILGVNTPCSNPLCKKHTRNANC